MAVDLGSNNYQLTTPCAKGIARNAMFQTVNWPNSMFEQFVTARVNQAGTIRNADSSRRWEIHEFV